MSVGSRWLNDPVFTDIATHIFHTHSGIVTNAVAIKRDLILAILKEMVASITATARGRLVITLDADLELAKTQKARNMGIHFHA